MRETAESGLTEQQEKALDAAQREVLRTGRAVRVDALTSETDLVTANTGGTVTWVSSVLPQRVRRNGVWIPVDSTLRRNSDGTFRAAAVVAPLSFSGGGDGPLVTMRNGKAALELEWPAPLPTPTVLDSTITYPDVLTGVDLTLTADTRGGFTQVLVVKTPEAAANPELASLKMTTRTTGVRVDDDGQGNLQATSPAGQVLFSAPAPRMWDSSAAVGFTGKPAPSGSPSASDAPDDPSNTRGPGRGAHSAPVHSTMNGSALTLTPDARMLKNRATRYPVFIDPSWSPHYLPSYKQHFVHVQEGCPTAKNYDSTAYGNPGVGYNGWSGCVGRERSYYQLGIPSAVWGTHIVSATVNATETYSSSCSLSSDVYLYSANSISAGTSWSTRPGLVSKLATRTYGPACTNQPSGGFDVTSTIAKVAAAKSASWTFALLNSSESDAAKFKRFAPNPSMSITYNHVPNPPSALSVNIGTSAYGCDTTAPYPLIGKTVSTTPPTLTSALSDGDRDTLAGTYTYWIDDGTPNKLSLTSANVASGSKAPVQVPSTFVNGLSDGTTVAWQVTATDGKDNRANTSVCHFTVDRRAPARPLVGSLNNVYPEHQPGAAAGTSGTFTFKVDPGTTNNNASKFVWGLDQKPPTSNPPATQVVTATNNAASKPITPPTPGTHILWVYALDAAGNSSEMYGYEFIALGHAPTTYASLAAAFNNTAVSDDAAPASADADGAGYSFSKQDLADAGWKSGGKVTVNGATFTLPAFGSGRDNVLAANQTILMNGAQGRALVFLATGTWANVAYGRNPADHSLPVIPEGEGTTATDCDYKTGAPTDCSPASGTVNYSDGTSSPYYLASPDWGSGGEYWLSAVSLPHRNGASGQSTVPSKIYSFAVPLKDGKEITSVSLPDVADKAGANIPALHIFGMAVRDTEKAPGTATWTTGWSAPSMGAFNYLSGTPYSDQTFRIAAVPQITGPTLRIRLSNSYGSTPLDIGRATVAARSGGTAVATSAPLEFTFSGSKSVTIPVGGEVYSDPLAFPVTAGRAVLVSYHLTNSAQYLVQHSYSAWDFQYMAPVGSGDHTMDTVDDAFNVTGNFRCFCTNVLSGVDVANDTAQTGVSVLGDDIVDPGWSGSTPVMNTPTFMHRLANRLRANPQAKLPTWGMHSAAIRGNRVAQNESGNPALLTRLDRDVLSAAGVRTAVVSMGAQDVVAGVDDTTVNTALGLLRDELYAWGIKTVFTTLTPCYRYSRCTDANDLNGVNVNAWISEEQDVTPPYVDHVDTAAALAVPDATSTRDPQPWVISSTSEAPYDSGDHVNLSPPGLQARADAFDLSTLAPSSVPGLG
ncbi:hypothetical protein ACFU3J_02120 [Streptomyces sp. NPDC057411]|uniref:hypothetical protein n=1 Tax=unclassified Streptomyces TaxID=2593676 RepID=UPI003634EE6F